MASLRSFAGGAGTALATLAIGFAAVAPGAAAPSRVYRVPSARYARPLQNQPQFTYNLLHAFTGADGTDATGYLDLAIQSNGNGSFTSTLFGITGAGGTLGTGNPGAGTIFSYGVDSGTFSSLYTFTGLGDGDFPQGGLANNESNYFPAGGVQLGVTLEGGQYGAGEVYATTNGGTPTVVHSFNGSDGSTPVGRITQFTDGNYYGTTESGGAYGFGTVFRITPGGQFSTIHVFTGNADGGAPSGLSLRVNLNGNANVARHGSVATMLQSMVARARASRSPRYVSPYLYGTTSAGGLRNGTGFGTIYRITPSGAFQTLYTFTNGGTGANPESRLSTDLSGNLYGTTSGGGRGGNGVVFQLIENSNTPIVIHDFGNGAGGASPQGSITVGLNGVLYGTASTGGASGIYGSVFQIDNGVYKDIHDFKNSDGATPTSTPLDGGNNYLYGTTSSGGPTMNGVLFSIRE